MKRYGRRKMGFRKAVLQVANTRKRDNMLPATVAPGDVFTNGATTLGAPGSTILWSPTSRFLDTAASNTKNPSAARTYFDCYAKGVRELVHLVQSGNSVWEWRRIVFEVKNPRIVDQAIVSSGVNYIFNADLAGGYRRLVNGMDAVTQALVQDGLFEGQINIDWVYPFTAKVDTRRVTLHSDQRRVLRSQNDNGNDHRFKFYYPLNKKLSYNDDELGSWSTNQAGQATLGRPGMGDLYIYDFFVLTVNATVGTNDLIFNPECTYYWHERS